MCQTFEALHIVHKKQNITIPLVRLLQSLSRLSVLLKLTDNFTVERRRDSLESEPVGRGKL